MKRFHFLFLSVLIILVSCKKENNEEPNDNTLSPTKSQWGFALNYTATWCGPCGNWGAPLIHDYADAGNVVAITAHASGDPMHIPALYSSFENVRTDGGGIPSFWVGDYKTTSISVMEDLLQQTPIAGLAMSSENNGTSMKVNTKTEFFEESSGDFYLSVFILESGIDGSASAGQYSQNGTANPTDYKHDFVLRASAHQNNAYGEMIIQNPAAGDISSNEFTIDLNESWENEVYAVAVLWRKNSSGTPAYQFINAIR